MAKVIGIGDVFIRSIDPKWHLDWYRNALNLDFENWYGLIFESKHIHDLYQMFSISPKKRYRQYIQFCIKSRSPRPQWTQNSITKCLCNHTKKKHKTHKDISSGSEILTEI